MAAHWTGKQCAQYFRDNGIENSANYCIGYDGDIWCNVEEQNRAWTSSSPWNDQRAITMELSCSAPGTDHITEATLEAFIKLAVDIALRYKISKYVYDGTPNGNFTLHKFYASTPCPGNYFISQIPRLIKEINARIAYNKSPFKDVKTTNSKYKYIRGCYDAGLVKGYPDRTFRPNNNMTRAEFCVMCNRLLARRGFNAMITKKSPFTDVNSNDPYYKHIKACYDAGLIKGYPDGTFRPDEAITRADTCIILYRLLKKIGK